MRDFIHTHVHSHYSLLSALPQIPDLIQRAKECNMSAIALTDNGSLYGAIEFYKACKKKEIKPIIGVDFYVAARKRTDKESRIDSRRTRLVLLARNFEGYQSLVRLVTFSHFDGFYYKPRVDEELLRAHNKGLLCIIPSWSSGISVALRNDDEAKALGFLELYKELYGKEHVFIEITHHPEIDGHEAHMATLRDFAEKTKTPIVAGQEVYYLNPEDKDARNTLMSIQSGGEIKDTDDDDADFSFWSKEQANEFYKDFPDALDNTIKIADLCNLELELGKWMFPEFPVESGRTHDEELRHVVMQGFARRKMEQTPETMERVNYELKVIADKGYSKYFLVVADLLRYAHENKILTTIRGSVAGSIVTYLAGITNVDPLEYKLPFERFLNPERPSAPDIDMDYADNRRDQVIDYTRKKYGHDKVAQIGTFGTMMARGAVRDTARALGFPYASADKIAKLIPMGAQGFPMTIDRAMEEVSELRELYEKDAETKQIMDMAKKIEGCARHISVHAAGVVIGPVPLTDVVPLQYDTKGEGKIITQYDMHAVGEDGMGLLKFDFLGITNLSILADAVERVKKIEGIDVDIENVKVDDVKTFEMLARGETIGLFQLNGTGMTKFLKDLKPSTIHDINAMVALYRPGPMESIPQYIERKHNPALVRYLDPRLKDILDRSYGVITYQDDVMMIAIKLAGYSWLEADKLRKAMGKKIPEEMQAQKEKLLKGFVANGLDENRGMQLWKLIEPFAAYGFNKAHAASYGRVAYQTAYMKANYPAIYMSAVLTAESGDVEKIGEIVAECKRMAIPILPPDINESYSQFTVIKGNKAAGEVDRIRFGLVTIKNFGQGAATAIIEERKRAGKFTSISDFLSRVKDKNLNRKSLEALIKAGAFDAFEERGKLLHNLDRLLQFNKEHGEKDASQDSLFGGIESPEWKSFALENASPMELREKLFHEKELLGLFLSGHPLDMHREALGKHFPAIKNVKESCREGQVIAIGGLIEEVKPISTKNGDTMAFIRIADFSGSIETVIFPRSFKEYRDMLLVDVPIAVKGKYNLRNGNPSLIIDKVKRL